MGCGREVRPFWRDGQCSGEGVGSGDEDYVCWSEREIVGDKWRK